MLEIVVAGGWVMGILILCSIAVIAISIERYWTLNPEKIAPKNTLGQVWNWIKNNQLDGQRLRELKQSSELGRILAAGLSNSRHGRDVMKDSIVEAANQVVHEMERYLGVLGTVASIAPLLGLLGTVLGMIKVFTAIVLEGSGNTSALAGGISEALITTAAGLCVAIPAMMLHRFYTRRVDTLVVTMEQEAVKLVDALHSERRVDVREAG
ncbi:MotA/TolQ/ExbB proton channel family protein [Pseudoteredinibacter isoporae]|uniref:Biopolymer transport protein ExbB n=1 Tax=Pseudoteredinibacter isoporae TaxID=570281 RepID=A0A7X0JV34_9GAMM|nr:biopolymer transport protein ExbB [Pseudoteredinibacter isoporae]NHO87473.1 MotA/TolQ/ExbB proton channel family protein [Pseudoteredinibacter isoporae]NIB24196.1 MotA/TolQ/ExbB proton channel family protein [Pseudoteredinibacter isoporae]